MKIFDEYFKIFEGAADSKYRLQATTTFSALKRAFPVKQEDMFSFPKAGQLVTAVNLGRLIDDPEVEDLDLWFVANRGGTKLPTSGKFVGSPRQHIELYFDIPPEKYDSINQKRWREIIMKAGGKALGIEQSGTHSPRENFYHEFTHYLDKKRIGDKGFSSAQKSYTSKNKEKYYNHPLETNAYTQQVLAKVDDYLSKFKSRETLTKATGKDANEFFNKVWKKFPAEMKKNLSDKNRNKLKKRIAQMWNEIGKRFGEKEK